jgi:glycosyltransferase involved in cell wall biosynthesis
MHIAMLGTRGVPARYGGFETCVEEVGWRLVAAGHQIDVYCRHPADDRAYRGMRCLYLPALRLKAAETLSHTILSVLHLITRRRVPDVVFVFNAANAVVLPLLKLRGVPTVVHMDGIEWQRSKWGRLGRAWYRFSERLAGRWGDRLIADATGIAEYLAEKLGAPSDLIAYGAPRVERSSQTVPAPFETDGYFLIVARFEPENHVVELMRGFSESALRHPLVVVGAAPYAASYQGEIERVANRDARIRLLGPVWDQEYLNSLYAHCRAYLHGHSVGGTNPSLLRACGAAANVIAWDTVFNREVAGERASYCNSSESVRAALDSFETLPSGERLANGLWMQEAVCRRYDWDVIAQQYADLAARLDTESDRSEDRHLSSKR